VKPLKLSDKYTKLEKERRLNPDYTTIERNAKKHGWKPIKKKSKTKIISNKEPKVPKVEHVKYPLFLKSKYWKYVHNLVVTRDGNKCTKCGATKRLQAHHLSYKHHFAEHKHLEDLITLCKSCHELEHKDKDK